MVEAEILVVDRELPAEMFALRRGATNVYGRGFSRWLAQPELGRFFVLIDGADEAYINVADETELIRVIGLQYLELMKRARANDGDGRVDLSIRAGVTPETTAKLSRLWELVQEKFAAGESSS